MKLGFTGTRHGMDSLQNSKVHELVQEAIELSEARGEPFEVHHGDCVGADEEFHNIVLGFGSFVSSIVIHPGWCDPTTEGLQRTKPGHCGCLRLGYGCA